MPARRIRAISVAIGIVAAVWVILRIGDGAPEPYPDCAAPEVVARVNALLAAQAGPNDAARIAAPTTLKTVGEGTAVAARACEAGLTGGDARLRYDITYPDAVAAFEVYIYDYGRLGGGRS